MSFAKLNSVQWLERYSLSHTCYQKIEKYREQLKNAISSLQMNEIRFKKWSNKGLDVTFQMHSIAKIFDIVEYLKN